MRALAVLILSAPAWAQAPASWRAAGGAGVTADLEATAVVVSAERAWRGPLALGAHGWAYTGGSGPVEDSPDVSGGGAGAFVAARTPGRLSLRATAGAGLAVLEVGPSPFCGTGEGEAPCRPIRPRAALPFASVGLGLDVAVAGGVGVGVEGRAAFSAATARTSVLEVGVRVRR